VKQYFGDGTVNSRETFEHWRANNCQTICN